MINNYWPVKKWERFGIFALTKVKEYLDINPNFVDISKLIVLIIKELESRV